MRVVLAIAVVSTVLLAACDAEGAQPRESTRGHLAVGDRAPGFTLWAADGTEVSLSQFEGRPVLLYFSMGPG